MKKVFLTGASSGIGLAIARALTTAGHEVWGTSRDISRLPGTPRLHPVTLDLRNAGSVRSVFNEALREAGSFDVLVNNAGSGHFGAAQALTQHELNDYFQVLVFAPIELMQLALETMHDQSHGLIINVTSLASRLPVPFMSAYNAAKAALASFTMSVQLELTNSTIRVVDLQPGDIHTNFNDVIDRRSTVDPRIERAWHRVDYNLRHAPSPDLVARRVLQMIDREESSPRVTVGDFFQARVAPLIFRLLPQRLALWGLKKYYRI